MIHTIRKDKKSENKPKICMGEYYKKPSEKSDSQLRINTTTTVCLGNVFLKESSHE